MKLEDGAKPPAAWLDHLHEAGHWQRLIEVATKSLATDPNDSATHRHLACAYARTDHVAEMKRQVDHCFRDRMQSKKFPM